MSPPRVWRWISFAGGLVLILAGGLGVTQVLTAPGGQDEAAWLGGWRLAAGIAVLLGAWWMGNRRRAGGVVVLAFGVGEIAADLLAGDLHGWAALLLAGGLLSTVGGAWAVSGRRFGALGALLAGLVLGALLAVSALGVGSWTAEVTLLAASALLVPLAMRLLRHPCQAPGWVLPLTLLGVIGLLWFAILAVIGLSEGWTVDQLRTLAAWPLTLVGSWLLLTSFMRLRDETAPPGWNQLGVLAGVAAVLTGAWMLLVGPSGPGLGTAPAVALALVALWATWLGGWQLARSA
jgi:hypothetical protein